MPGDDTFFVHESHEERIQRAENNIGGISSKLAEVSIKQDHMLGRFEEAFSNIKDGQDKILNFQEKFDKRLSPLEHDHKERQKTKEVFKKIAIPLLIAGAGIFTTKMAEIIWEKLF